MNLQVLEGFGIEFDPLFYLAECLLSERFIYVDVEKLNI